MNVQERLDDEINLMEYYNIIRKRKKIIIVTVSVAVVLSIVVSLLMPNIYRAQAVIAPVEADPSVGGASALLGSLGLVSPSSSITDVVALLNSRIIRERMVKKHKLLPVLTEEGLAATVLSFIGLKSDKTEDEKMWDVIDFLSDALLVTYDDKKGVVQITMDFKDPKVSEDIVNNILTELSDYMAYETRRVALVNKKAMEEQLNSTTDPLIRVKIYDMVSKQIEKTVMAEAKENAFFKVLDPPKFPVEKYKPKRALIVIAVSIASLFLGIVIAFAKDFIDKSKSAPSKEDEKCS